MAAVANIEDDVSQPAGVPSGGMMAKGRDRKKDGSQGNPKQGAGGGSLSFLPLVTCPSGPLDATKAGL